MSARNDSTTIDLPSGEMCGNQLLNSSPVICCCSEPSGRIFQICIRPVREELKKIHARRASTPVHHPRLSPSSGEFSSPPSAGILYTSSSPFRPPVKTSHLASGDQPWK